MSERRRGLGRGLGALIPQAPPRIAGADGTSAPPSPVDVFFPPASAPTAPSGEQRTFSAVVESPQSRDDADGQTAVRSSPERAGEATEGGGTGAQDTADTGGDAPATSGADAYFADIPIAAIRPNPRQPRTVFDDDELAELVHSIREVGLLQPVVVRPVDADGYELVMGERRWRAARQAGLATLPAIVRQTEDSALLRDALLENLHRSQLNPLEEAAAYDQLLTDFGCTHDELADRVGRSRPQISNTLRLLRLPAAVQRRVAAGVLSAGHARALLGLPDGGAQERLAQRIVAEGLSVRAVEEVVSLGDVPGDPMRRGPRAALPTSPRLGEIAGRLSDRFETRVKVDLGRSKGKIIIDFATIDDLERIIALMAPAAPEETSALEDSA